MFFGMRRGFPLLVGLDTNEQLGQIPSGALHLRQGSPGSPSSYPLDTREAAQLLLRLGTSTDSPGVDGVSGAMTNWAQRNPDWLLALLRFLRRDHRRLRGDHEPPGLGHPLLIQSMIG